jgi:hypothetical protein
VWTGSLWASVSGHITFNSLQVLLFYLVGDTKEVANTYQKPDFPVWLSIIFAGIFIFVVFLLQKINNKNFLNSNNYCSELAD